MTKKDHDANAQLSFDLSQWGPVESVVNPSVVTTPSKVVSFVDATTLAIRRDAVERVRNSGVFTLASDTRLEA